MNYTKLATTNLRVRMDVTFFRSSAMFLMCLRGKHLRFLIFLRKPLSDTTMMVEDLSICYIFLTVRWVFATIHLEKVKKLRKLLN